MRVKSVAPYYSYKYDKALKPNKNKEDKTIIKPKKEGLSKEFLRKLSKTEISFGESKYVDDQGLNNNKGIEIKKIK